MSACPVPVNLVLAAVYWIALVQRTPLCGQQLIADRDSVASPPTLRRLTLSMDWLKLLSLAKYYEEGADAPKRLSNRDDHLRAFRMLERVHSVPSEHVQWQ